MRLGKLPRESFPCSFSHYFWGCYQLIRFSLNPRSSFLPRNVLAQILGISLSHTHAHSDTQPLLALQYSHLTVSVPSAERSYLSDLTIWFHSSLILTIPPRESLSYINLLFSSRALFSSYTFTCISLQVHCLFLPQVWSSILKTGIVWFVYIYTPRAYYCLSKWVSERTKRLLCPLCQEFYSMQWYTAAGFLPAYKSQLLNFQEFTKPVVKQLAWNWPCWEYLYHEH